MHSQHQTNTKQTPNKHQTPNKRQTNAKRQTPNTKHQTPNTKHQTPNTKHQTPNTKHQMSSTHITMYTDGSSRGNPGPGGYGVVLMFGTHRKEISKGFKHTTNNRMELMAVIEGLKAISKKEIPVKIYSDSQYVVNSIEKGWLNTWIKTNFKGGKKNSDLWKTYYELSKSHSIKMIWVKGHADNPFNNRCDELATSAADGKHLIIDEGYEG